MPRMIDLIRTSSVPATLMQAAARGALSVPAAEMIEILVYLAKHNKIFGQQARMTLAGWDESASLAAAADSSTPPEVLDYLIAPENLRPRLLPALLENPSIPEETLTILAGTGSREVVEAMRQSERVKKMPAVLHALASNGNASQQETTQREQLAEAEEMGATVSNRAAVAAAEPVSDSAAAETPSAPEEDAAVHAFLTEHAQELAIEGENPFQPLGGIYEFEQAALDAPEAAVEEAPAASLGDTPPPASTAASPAAPQAAAVAAAATAKMHRKTQLNHDDERGSALQKIAKLDVKGRIQVAMKGNKEERSILIRDGTKLVALAVLESGKITDGEVEKFASQKNVLEAVLRQIPMKRRFAKNYNVVRNLVANPRTPLDVSLGLMKNLLVADLRHLSSNKEVSETIRKLALKMFKQKTDTSKRSH